MPIKEKIAKLKQLVATYEQTQDPHQSDIILGQILGFISAL